MERNVEGASEFRKDDVSGVLQLARIFSYLYVILDS